ncbi:MAG: MerR family transcriptional regulator [Clostridiales bacterium]|nr:MerR family transcriptional regulator [Clostridiales bacterium]
MYYTIGQISDMFKLPVSTLRYYDKEGFSPNLKRVSGIRRFSETEIDTLRVIECLKKSGLEIKDIKLFMDWCCKGAETYPQRKELFEKQKAAVEKEILRLNKVLDMIKYKCWYYEQAIKDGNEDRLKAITPDEMPEEIREAFISSHSEHD